MTNKEVELEDLWDWICVQVGFDKKGKEIQRAIKDFIKLKEKEKVCYQVREGKTRDDLSDCI